MATAVEAKHIPVVNPSFNADESTNRSRRYTSIAIPMQAIIINKKVPAIILAVPLFLSGLFMLSQTSSAHLLPNKDLEYQTAPNMKYAAADANTASQLNPEKIDEFIIVGFVSENYSYFEN